MEMLLILAAIAVAGLALAIAAAMSAQARRPPLRMQREVDLADGDEEGLIRSLRPAPKSPIDRTRPIVEADWSEAELIDTKAIEKHMDEAKPVADSAQQTDGPGDARRSGAR